MNAEEARAIGANLAQSISRGKLARAQSRLEPILGQRTAFRFLDVIGEAAGQAPLPNVNAFLNRIAADGHEGGWVIIGAALRAQLPRDLSGTLARCRDAVLQADVWYAADILAERVPGPALLGWFEQALALLSSWREDDCAWVRRAAGVAVHFWAKRAHGAAGSATRAGALLAFLEPLFEERDVQALKGIGWGLKTLGRYYTAEVTSWLEEQVERKKRPCRALMLRKALTYLPRETKARLLGETPR
jgi:3-methyladenine DNA glycosylase AlkD